MADLHHDISHVQINRRTLNIICSKPPGGAEHIVSSVCVFTISTCLWKMKSIDDNFLPVKVYLNLICLFCQCRMANILQLYNDNTPLAFIITEW